MSARLVARIVATASVVAACSSSPDADDGTAASGAAAGAGMGGAGGSSGTPGSGGGTAGMGAAGAAGSGGGGGGAASPGCGAGEWPASGTYSLDVDGTTREYIVEIPEGYDASAPHRLVLAWHGFTITAEQVAGGGFFGIEPLAGGSAIFVAGQGLDTTLLGTTAPGWDNDDGRDVAFARALVDQLRASYCIDEERIFSAGSSMGGYFSNQLGCEMGDVLRAVASMIGGGPLEIGGAQCDEQRMAAWITHGNMDAINPFSQGEASRDHWASVNHCSGTTTPVGPAACVAYEGCDAGYPVHWCEFDGGHVQPDFAPEGMWGFFSQF